MVTDAKILALRQAISEILGRDDCLASLGEDEPLHPLGLDSVKLINLVIMIEKQFAVTFEDNELLNENFGTLRMIIGKIDEKLGARA
ncbi:acyl carrier protein [Paenibacillus sp. MMS18-CY102]|uniref:acyl carrier protein n=1 Tax=Paenibacillus sp. MMS18-CY102 TaxID=2682849 RepID=UPI001365D0FC|nr:acyl carrier protein [Paenibacillus sp. MMS18-CY102]MWC29848.1 acyl carrier protein [Paenibacillus sp. MMS18-CY102]